MEQARQHAEPDDSWHRALAARLFNTSWDLLDRTERTPADDLDLLTAAFASRWHWAQVGGRAESTIADLHVARAASALGLGDLAVRAAASGLAGTQEAGFDDWRLATAYEAMARACAAAGDAAARDRYIGLADAALADIADPEDRDLVAGQLDEVRRAAI